MIHSHVANRANAKWIGETLHNALLEYNSARRHVTGSVKNQQASSWLSHGSCRWLAPDNPFRNQPVELVPREFAGGRGHKSFLDALPYPTAGSAFLFVFPDQRVDIFFDAVETFFTSPLLC